MPVSKITLDDGTTLVNVDGYATLGLQHRTQSLGGSGLVQFAGGNSEKHTNWQKLRITITASGWQPPQLDALDFSKQITMTIHDWAAGSKSYSVFCDRPVLNEDIHGAAASWTLTATEVS